MSNKTTYVFSQIVDLLPMIKVTYEIGTNPETNLPYSKFEQDAGEFFTDFLDNLSQETKEVENSFSAKIADVSGRCER